MLNRRALVLVALVMALSCTVAAAQEGPREVADRFLALSQAEDTDAAKQLLLPDEREGFSITEDAAEGTYSLGEERVEGKAALVTYTTTEPGGQPEPAALVLIQQEDGWKVSMGATIMLAMTAGEAADFGAAFTQVAQQINSPEGLERPTIEIGPGDVEFEPGEMGPPPWEDDDSPTGVVQQLMSALMSGDAAGLRPLLVSSEADQAEAFLREAAPDFQGGYGFGSSTGDEVMRGDTALVMGDFTPGGQGDRSVVRAFVLRREQDQWRVSPRLTTQVRQGGDTRQAMRAAFDRIAPAAAQAAPAAAAAQTPAPASPAPETPAAQTPAPAPAVQTPPSPAPPAAPAETPAAAAPPGEAQAAPAAVSPTPRVLVSIYKPILFGILIGLWAFAVSWIDKDVARFHLGREMWNGVQMACGIVAIIAWLLIPWFWLGIFVALLIMGGGLGGYIFYRNPRVPEGQEWTFSLSSFTQRIEDMQGERRGRAAAVRIIGADGQPVDVPRGDTPEGQAQAQLENLIDFALPRNAEEIELLAGSSQTAVSVTIDGVKYPQEALEPALGVALIDYLKQYAGLDVADRRRRQSGRLKIETEGEKRHNIEVTTFGSTRGQALEMRFDLAGRHKIPFNHLGLIESQKQQLAPALDAVPNKVVMVVCPPGQGMTTTLYSLVSRHDPYTITVVTLEDEIQAELEGVTQEQIDFSGDPAEINQKIKALMLRETNVLMLSRLTDPSTAKAVVDGSDIARFYVGMRQDDNFAAMKAWVKAVGEPEIAASSMLALISPRLVRRLCPTCKVPYKPDLDALRKLNLPADKVGNFYKHSGQVMVRDKPQPCPDCFGLGYRGRLAVFELMVLDDDARALIVEGQYDQLRTHLRKKRTLWLQEAALARVVEGQTSVSEATRAMARNGK